MLVLSWNNVLIVKNIDGCNVDDLNGWFDEGLTKCWIFQKYGKLGDNQAQHNWILGAFHLLGEYM